MQFLSLVDQIPLPQVVHSQIGHRLREIALLRRLLRLSQEVHREHAGHMKADQATGKEVAHAG